MARRRRRAPTKRRTRPQGFNIKNAAFAYGAAEIATRAVTNLGIVDFLTAGTMLNRKGISMAGHYSGQASGVHIHTITLKEIMSGMNLLNDGTQAPPDSRGGNSLTKSLVDNISNNAFEMVVGLVSLKAADKILTKTGVWRNTNKVLKGIGVKSMVRV